jgi:hypothetical protein
MKDSNTIDNVVAFTSDGYVVKTTIDDVVILGFQRLCDFYAEWVRWYLPKLPLIREEKQLELSFPTPRLAHEFYLYLLKAIKEKEPGLLTLEDIAKEVTEKTKNGNFFSYLIIEDITGKSNFSTNFQGEFADFVVKFELSWRCYNFIGETPEECYRGIIEESIKRGITPEEYIELKYRGITPKGYIELNEV